MKFNITIDIPDNHLDILKEFTSTEFKPATNNDIAQSLSVLGLLFEDFLSHKFVLTLIGENLLKSI